MWAGIVFAGPKSADTKLAGVGLAGTKLIRKKSFGTEASCTESARAAVAATNLLWDRGGCCQGNLWVPFFEGVLLVLLIGGGASCWCS